VILRNAWRNNPFNSISNRLISWYFLFLSGVILVTLTILHSGLAQPLHYGIEEILEARLGEVRGLLQDRYPDPSVLSHLLRSETSKPDRMLLRIISPDGSMLYETVGMEQLLPASLFTDFSDTPIGGLRDKDVSAGGRNYCLGMLDVPAVPPFNRRYLVQAAIDDTIVQELLNRYLRLTGIVAALVLLAIAAALRIIVRWELRPVQLIAAAMEAIDGATLNKRLTIANLPSELSGLALHFNAMLARLDTAYAGLRNFTDNISHELRNPVNRLLQSTEVTLLKPRSVAEYEDVLATNVEECRRLARILEALLLLARLDQGQFNLVRKPILVANELRAIVEFYDASVTLSGASITTSCADDLTIDADVSLFQRAVGNLISNAIDHTPAGGTIAVSAVSRGDQVVIEVADTGEGITREHLPHVFDRFYRASLTKSLSSLDGSPGPGPKAGGRTGPVSAPAEVTDESFEFWTLDGKLTVEANASASDVSIPDPNVLVSINHLGMGLAIVKSIVEAHGGTVSLQSELNEGTKIVLIFPVHATVPGDG
jgi:two-component system, OmpR family, heavy metal sensor histidine kinase CusS